MILIIDDSEDAGVAMRRLVSAAGYRCHWVTSGAEGLSFVRKHPPDQPLLLILDEMMPGMSGREVLTAIRADPTIAQTAVISYTSEFEPAGHDAALSLGALAHLHKASDVELLLKTISDCYQRIGGKAKTPSRGSSPKPARQAEAQRANGGPR